MSQADVVMKNMLKNILENGTDTKGAPNRPIWVDTGETAYTRKLFGVVNRYDLRKEFPAGTLRKLPFKSCVDELLWIWQAKSNNVHYLNSHIWDQWADKKGSIGKAYGYQVWSKTRKLGIEHLSEVKQIHMELVTPKIPKDQKTFQVDQMDYILHQVKYNPYSRRIIGNLYNIEDLDEMNLDPCCYSVTFNVTDDGKVLNMILNQRSADTIVAGAWNVAQYAVLLALVAHCTGLIAGELVHVIADAHIYDRHMEIAKELINRPEFPAPKLWINPKITDFYKLTVDDIQLYNYTCGEQIKNIPVAK